MPAFGLPQSQTQVRITSTLRGRAASMGQGGVNGFYKRKFPNTTCSVSVVCSSAIVSLRRTIWFRVSLARGTRGTKSRRLTVPHRHRSTTYLRLRGPSYKTPACRSRRHDSTTVADAPIETGSILYQIAPPGIFLAPYS